MMGRPIWCRFCAHPAKTFAGIFPAKCEKCSGEGFWSTQPISELLDGTDPLVPFIVTEQDYQLFLRHLRISRD